MNDSQPSEGLEREAIEAFAKYIELDESERPSFEELCTASPELESELRRLQQNFERLEGFLGGADGLVDSLAEVTGDASGAAGRRALVERLASALSPSRRYSSHGELGRGGMGVVLRTWDAHLRREIAMKVLRGSEGAGSGSSGLDPKRMRRFLEEVEITGQLDHPGVVPVHELGVDDEGRLFFTMRLVRGRDLRAILQLAREEREGWSRERALSALLRVCETMAFAHEHGVIHRDLKPANVMVGRHGETYVMDWGLARVLPGKDRRALEPQLAEASLEPSTPDPDDQLLTSDGTVVGTPSYMPPEQARGELDAIGPHSDVYAVGAMLYHLLTGHPPFLEHDEPSSSSRVLERLLVGPPAPLDPARHSIPPALAAICARAMSREPANRYADMGEMAEDLRAYLEGRVVQAYQTGALAEFRTWVRRNRGMAAAITVGLLLAIAGSTSTAIVQARSNQVLEVKNTELDQARAAALDEAERATTSERLAKEERGKLLRLADLERLEELRQTEGVLYPARPDQIDALRSWLAATDALAERLPLYRTDLAELQQHASPRSSEEVESSAGKTVETALARKRLERAQQQLKLRSAGGASTAELAVTRELLAEYEQRVEELVEAESRRRPWLFESNEQAWHYDQLARLIEELEQLLEPERGLRARVQQRLDFASQVTAQTVTGAEAARLWSEALRSISNPAECPLYNGLSLEPQLGLLPLGRSEYSGLWEFLLTETGSAPALQMDGSLALEADSGLVFVLLPGAAFDQGSRPVSNQTPVGSPYADPFAEAKEHPLTRVELAPFFISKYELTQAQWMRMTGDNPSVCKAGSTGVGVEPYTWQNPVDNLSYFEARRTLERFGMTLPSEAQWEFAARSGTSSIFWSGDDPASLNGVCNSADLSWSQARTTGETDSHAPWEDGWIGSAPVGSYFPNFFGLHDTVGNLWEWCLDRPAANARPRWAGTGESLGGNDGYRMVRGGSFNESAINLRSAKRQELSPDARSLDVGVRPVVLIE